MTEQSIAKKGIILNTVLIIATVVAFIVIKITNQYLTSNFGLSGYRELHLSVSLSYHW